jgi:D-alanyl-D-alanine carboxypeptidase/D-alanyl-D-alanine-endopeptidase (penicillin-binding protein 4)
MVDQGRRAPTTKSRVKDPARQAGQKFAELLRAAGVKVTAVSAAKAPADATVIAKVESPPVDRIVQVMLTESENTYAEMLAHLVGGAAVGKASFAGGGEATRGVLAAIDIDTGGYFLADGSGLSRDDRLTATTLASILATVVRGSHPELSSIATGLPIAGLTGTLADRYELLAAQAGRGFVHAKTGTLTGVVAESGIVLDASGRQLVFSFIATRVRSIDAMRRTLDGMASTLATCGCTS